MGWQENISTNIIIVTGDGKTYEPLYKINSKSKEYNVSQFNFPEVDGTLVDRRRPKGAKHTLELVFQGEDHLDTIKAFEKSADDKRPWVVYHPMYGNLNGQPIKIDFDTKALSLTQVKIEFVESIVTALPKVSIDPKDKVVFDSDILQDLSAEAFETNVIEPSAQDRIQMGADVNDAYNTALTTDKTDLQAQEYFNLFTQANSSINNGVDKGKELANFILDLMIYPSLFSTGIRSRLSLLRKQFDKIGTRLSNIEDPSSKNVYEMNAGGIVNAMCAAAVNPLDNDDYGSAVDVMAATDDLIATWNQFVKNLDANQTTVGGDPESYIPDATSVSALNSLVVLSASQLFNIALSARQERSIILEDDSNVINLTHRFYGITAGDDSEIEEFMRQNNIGLSEILQIKKGRKIVYYV